MTVAARPPVAPVTPASGVADLASLGPVVLADVRWYLDGRDGQAAYEAAHVPGAVWVDLDAHLAAHGRPAADGRHPLPDAAAFAASMSSLGIGDDTVVVAYDDTGGMSAGRLVVMLRVLGRRATLLDGGLGAWTADGRPVESGPAATPVPAAFTVTEWPTEAFATADEVAARAAAPDAGRPMVDGRARERFTGEVAMIDPRPGHVPGARSAPWNAVLGDGTRVRTPADLRRHYAALGVDDATAGDTIAYCGSGVSACMNVLAMEHAGLARPRLFVASWSGWSSDPDRPAALGDA